MKIETKIKKELDKFFNKDKEEFDYQDIEDFTRDLEAKNIINYSIVGRNTDMDYWMQAEGYVNTRGKGFTIIFDYDAPSEFNNRERFIEILIDFENEFQKINNKLKNLKI